MSMLKRHPAMADGPKYGALWGGGDSGGSSTNTVQKADPWAGQQPFLQGGADTSGNPVPGVLPEAAKLYQNNPLQFYSGQTYADLSPETQQANSMQTTRAMNGSPVMNASNQSLQDTLSGKYLDINTNPYLMPAAQNIMSEVLPQVNSQFAASGRGNSGLASRAASRARRTLCPLRRSTTTTTNASASSRRVF
jgi:hypothetical protein